MHIAKLLLLISLCRAVKCESAAEQLPVSNNSDNSDPHGASPGPEIRASLALVSLLEVSELRSEIVFSCFLKASWTAGRPHGGREDPFTPRLIPAGARRVDNAGFLAPVTTVHRRGDRLEQVALVTVAQRCAFDYSLFPFDTQTCLIRISPVEGDATIVQSENASDVRVEPDFDSFQHEFTPQVRQVPYLAAERGAAVAGQPRSALAVRLRLRRRLGPHLVRLFAPSALLVTAGWLAALVPASLIRSRLPVTILSLLSLLLACDTARQTGAHFRGPGTAGHLWETGCLLFSLVSVLESVLDMQLVVRAVARGDPQLERTERCGARIYFWLYALCWVVYCLAYWLAYLPRWRSSLDETT